MTVYLIRSECGRVKIGFTEAASADARLTSMRTGSPRRLEILASFAGDRGEEQRLHNHCEKEHAHGEWFDPGPCVRGLFDHVSRNGNAFAWRGEPAATAALPPFPLSAKTVKPRRLANPESTLEPISVGQVAFEWRQGRGAELDRHVLHIVSGDRAAPELEWRHQGRNLTGNGLDHTLGCLRDAERDGRDAVAVTWLSACLHDLTRGAFGIEELLERFPEAMALKAVVDGASRGSWHHLSPALPDPVVLPEVCSLSRPEFIAICARHVRLVLAESVIVQRWAAGKYVRIDRTEPPWRIPFGIGATP